MTSARTLGNTAFRDYVEDGTPSSGPNHPLKSEIRAFVDALVRGELRTDDFTAEVGGRYNVDTTTQAVLGVLPAQEDLTVGDEFVFNDNAGTWADNNFTLTGSDSVFDDGAGGTVDDVVMDHPARVVVTYVGDGVFRLT